MAWKPNSFTIIQGDDVQLAIFILDTDGNPVNLSGLSAISMRLKMRDGSILEKAAVNGFSYGLMNHAFWLYGFYLTQEETALLPLANAQTVEMKISYGSMVKTLDIAACLNVVSRKISA